MKAFDFQGTLNSKSRYGQSYSDYSVLRLFKWCRIQDLSPKYNPLRFKWYKKHRHGKLSWSNSSFDFEKGILCSQRMWNDGIKDKRIKLMRWEPAASGGKK